MNASRVVRCGLSTSRRLGACQWTNTGALQGPARVMSSVPARSRPREDSFLSKILKKIPGINFNRNKIVYCSYGLYQHIADELNYSVFFKELALPDTFYSWFTITELHVWLLSVRAMAEGDDGRQLRNALVAALWADVGLRVKKLGAVNPAAMRAQIEELNEQMQAALIAYDEGLQSSDCILAGAIWRRFYQQGDVDPVYLHILVKYVRKQVRLLDQITPEDLFDSKLPRWSSIK